jgi:hypothetical protein
VRLFACTELRPKKNHPATHLRIKALAEKCDAAATIVWQSQKNLYHCTVAATDAGNAWKNKK